MKLSAWSCIPRLHSVGSCSELKVASNPAREIFLTISTSARLTGSYHQVQVSLPVSMALSASYAALDFAPHSQPNGSLQFLPFELMAAQKPWELIGRRSYGNAHNHLWTV